MITREEFESGVHFSTKESASIKEVYKFKPSKGIVAQGLITDDYNQYRCNVYRINNSGFTAYSNLLGKSTRRRVLFSNCIKIELKETS